MELAPLSPRLVQIIMFVICAAIVLMFVLNWLFTGQGPIHMAMNSLRFIYDKYCDVIRQLPSYIRWLFSTGELCK